MREELINLTLTKNVDISFLVILIDSWYFFFFIERQDLNLAGFGVKEGSMVGSMVVFGS